MSSVLIGIIGVILFIGLAVAGVTFLGPRFQESQSNARAATVLQGLAQITASVNLENVRTNVTWNPKGPGNGANSDSGMLITRGRITAWPVNPVVAANRPFLLTEGGAGQDPSPARLVVVSLGNGTGGKRVCDAIIRQTRRTVTSSQTAVRVNLSGTNMKDQNGCTVSALTNGALGVVAGDYVAWTRI